PAPIIYSAKTTHPDQHAAAFAMLASGASRIYVGNDGGAYRQDIDPTTGIDVGSWTSVNDGLSISQPYAAAMSRDGVVYAGLQDNGTVKILPNGRADMVYGGDGFDVAVDPADSKIAFEEYANGAIRKTTNGGQTWTLIDPTDATGQRFYTPFEMDRKDADHLIYGACQIWESDKGSGTASGSWRRVFDPDPSCAETDPYQGLCSTQPIDGCPTPALGTTAVDLYGNAAYAALCRGSCNVTTDDGGMDPTLFKGVLATNVKRGCKRDVASKDCWHLAAGRGLPHRLVTGLAVDPKNPATIYASVGSFSRHWTVPLSVQPRAVYRSTNGGDDWADITGNLPPVFGGDVAVLRDTVVLATDAGVYAAKTSDPKRWVPMGTGLPAGVPGFEVSFNPQGTKVVLATHGRGVWVLTL
ncbi:MAG: hypothetical protein ABR520_08185, partial [Mycobacteriales bacterium]